MIGPVIVAGVGLAVGLAESWWADRARASAGPAAKSMATRMLRVLRVVRESDSTTSLVLEPVAGPPLNFVAGQFIQVRHADLWRSYSLSSAPGQPLRLTIKRVPGGRVSGALIDGVGIGDQLEVRGPFGSFGAGLPPRGELWFMAGGSGITPFAAMVHDLARRESAGRVRMFAANRTSEDAPLIEELRAVLGDRLTTHFDSDDGAVDARKIAAYLAAADRPAGIWLCGPAPMMELVAAQAQRSWPGVMVAHERFSASAPDPLATTRRVTIVRRGQPTVLVVEPGQTLLEASRRSSAAIPSGCEQGACGTCKLRVLSGTVDMPESTCLSPAERALGYALACVGQPSDAAILEIDP